MKPDSTLPEQSLRPATADDLPSILEIESKVHVAPWTRGHFEAEMEKPYSRILLMTDDESDQIVFGYIVFWMLGEALEILNIVVDLPYRGLGLAEKMVRAAIKIGTQDPAIKRAQLEVRKSNLPAIQLYQKVGLGISQIRKQFYSNGEDAYCMTLDLRDDATRLNF